MTRVLLPTPRIALRTPAVQAALVAVVMAPTVVRWVGEAGQAPTRLRVVGMLLAALLALAWDDRCAVVTAPTPVGLPAVRHGRALVVVGLLLSAYGLSCAVVADRDLPWNAVHLQTGAMALTVTALVGWLARDREGGQLLTLPVPVLLGTVVVLSRLPFDLALLRDQPGTPGWPGERARWWTLLIVSLFVIARLDRDQAVRGTLRHR